MSIAQKAFNLLLVAVLVGSYIALAAIKPVSAQGEYVKGQILVKFKDGVGSQNAQNILKNEKAAVKSEIAQIGVKVISVPQGAETRVISALSRNPNVEFAEPDYIGTSTAVNDPQFGQQYGLDNNGQPINDSGFGVADADINAPEAWAVPTVATSKIRIAVLDSGVDTDHEDIDTVLDQDFSGSSTGVEDIYGHGTHVAGIIAATANNNTGVASVCPNCEIISGKVLNDEGYGATSWITNGIGWSTTSGAKVINMSLGFRTSSRTLEAAVNNAWNNGVVIVASAGNGANTRKEYPGAYPNVISVAATNNKDQKASFSTYGSWVSITAPGENVYSTFPNHPFVIQNLYGRSNNYDFANGTSMSSPMVAGVAGMVLSKNPSFTAAQVRSQVEGTADKIGGEGSLWKHGRVNALRALTETVTTPDEPVVTNPKGPKGRGNQR